MKVAIIKYNSGNVCSVQFALERIGISALVTDDAAELKSSDRVIFPGVGEASGAMNYLRNQNLDKLIVDLKQPVLGICLGMQLMCDFSEEGKTQCLGIFNQNVLKFSDTNKVPQIGWNTISNLNSTLFNKISEEEYMYFVHSYYVELGENTIANTNYGFTYSSAVEKNNFFGVQFHPEKSAEVGQLILKNFLSQ